MSEEKDDYSYWSENLHSAYLFYTLEVDKLNKENKQMREALEKIKEYCSKNDSITWFDYDNIEEIIQQTLNKGVE